MGGARATLVWRPGSYVRLISCTCAACFFLDLQDDTLSVPANV
jgi:hypothetical protein